MTEEINNCPLPCAGAKMAWNSFASACLARQAKKMVFNPCVTCKIGVKIAAGEKCTPPKGITIFTPTDWTPAPIKFPLSPSGWGNAQTTIYPFSSMKVGEIYEGEVENKVKIRCAYSNMSRKYGKKFVGIIKDNKFIVERIK